MGGRSLNKEEPEAIRMAFQRICQTGGAARLIFGNLRGEFRVLAEAPDRVILGISDLERGQWRLKPGARLTLQVTDRGIPFEAVVDFQGHGRFHGTEACHVTLPRVLRALDTHRLADFVPDRALPCPFGDQHHDVKDGHALAFGEDGLELAPPEGTRVLGDVLRLHATSTIELRTPGGSLVLPVRVVYFGEGFWGMRFSDQIDPQVLGRYRQWLVEARRDQLHRDRNVFDPKGYAPSQVPVKDAAQPTGHAHLLVDKDPLLLVLAEGEGFPMRLAEAVRRKFGVAALDVARAPLRPQLADLGAGDEGWGRVRLILVYHHVRGGSALETCRKLAQEEACPLPILIAGTEEDAELKRNRALGAGAVDFLVVEPFKVLNVLHALDDTLKLFE